MVLTMLIRGLIQISNVGGQSVGPVQTSPSQLGPNKNCYTQKNASLINPVMILLGYQMGGFGMGIIGLCI